MRLRQPATGRRKQLGRENEVCGLGEPGFDTAAAAQAARRRSMLAAANCVSGGEGGASSGWMPLSGGVSMLWLRLQLQWAEAV